MLVKYLALEWGSLGVRVNAVSPGPIAGTEGLARLSGSPEIESTLRDITAVKALRRRVGHCPGAAAYLGSADARYGTGTILDYDGGMHLGNFPALCGIAANEVTLIDERNDDRLLMATFNRPEAMNGIDVAMADALMALIEHVKQTAHLTR